MHLLLLLRFRLNKARLLNSLKLENVRYCNYAAFFLHKRKTENITNIVYLAYHKT